MMKKFLLFIGPVLFLLAEVILPAGSADPAARIAIIQDNSLAWELGHQLIAVAFVFLLLWLGELYNLVREENGRIAYTGVLLAAFALAGDYGVGILQLLALDLVETLPTDQAQSILAMLGQSTNMMAFAFLPTLGFLVGFGLLAAGFYRSVGQTLPAVLLAASGLLIALGGILQMKIVFILGALALLSFTAIWSQRVRVTAKTLNKPKFKTT